MVKYQDGIMKFKYNQPPTSVLRYGGLSAYFETLLLNQSLGIFSNFGAKNPPHRKAEKRQAVKKLTFFLFNFYFHYAAR